MIIDLHSHSTRSDGKESPTEVFAHAAAASVDVLALTDHDTADGWAEAREAAARASIGFVPGIEVTTRAEVARGQNRKYISVHMLAYLPDPANHELATALSRNVNTRELRAQRMVELLAEDYEISWDSVLAELAHGATIGRPAIADALVSAGYFADRSEVFHGPLSRHSKYYVPTETLDVVRAIELIRAAGGVPIIAHPLGGAPESMSRDDLPEEHFEMLIAAGMAGFEVEHREVPQVARDWLRMLAAKHDLITTGSSDYHGLDGKPNRLGENSTSQEMLQRILVQASGVEPSL